MADLLEELLPHIQSESFKILFLCILEIELWEILIRLYSIDTLDSMGYFIFSDSFLASGILIIHNHFMIIKSVIKFCALMTKMMSLISLQGYILRLLKNMQTKKTINPREIRKTELIGNSFTNHLQFYLILNFKVMRCKIRNRKKISKNLIMKKQIFQILQAAINTSIRRKF